MSGVSDMRVFGVDFTSRPGRRRPIVCAACSFDGKMLRARLGDVRRWDAYAFFDAFLRDDGPWIAALDFPFAQSRRFIENIGWPRDWTSYVRHAETFGRAGFRAALDAYRQGRPAGDREHQRAMDKVAGAISPQKLYGVPVGLMFFEGAPRLVHAGVHIPFMQQGDRSRIVVEGYPGVLARNVIGRRPYKTDSRAMQNNLHLGARVDLLARLRNGEAKKLYGFELEADDAFASDPGGDVLDALLCAIQAAWAWSNRENRFGAPAHVDPLEGWIADPAVRAASVPDRSAQPT